MSQYTKNINTSHIRELETGKISTFSEEEGEEGREKKELHLQRKLTETGFNPPFPVS